MRSWLKLLIVGLILLGGVWLGSNPDAIAQLVDEVRNIVGPAPVAAAEDIFYGAVDQVNQVLYRGRTTPGYWDVARPTDVPGTIGTGLIAGVEKQLAPLIATADAGLSNLPSTALAQPKIVPEATPPPAQTDGSTGGRSAPLSPFHPTDFKPIYPTLAAPGEGIWFPMPNTMEPAAPPLMFKSFLHPDPQRSYTRMAVVAMDTTRLQFHVVAGTKEPVSYQPVTRTGLIPLTDLSSVLAAFNGGFRAIHGHYGMMVNGQVILPPQPNGDTIALYRDGSIRIAPWSIIASSLPQMISYRQTPPYLVYEGQINPALVDEKSTMWGAAVDRNTVIWRSALGLSADHRTLYYGVGESLTARRLAEAMVATGASDVAELDVNWGYERFLTYTPPSGDFKGTPLLPGMNFKPEMYTRLPAERDFFYATLAAPTVQP